MHGTQPDEISFSHVVLEGTPYEVGRLQAERLQDDPQRSGYLAPTPPFLERYSEEEAERELAFLERYCPGLEEEVQGAADALGVSAADIAFLGGKPKGGGQCSHFAVLPSLRQMAIYAWGRTRTVAPATWTYGYARRAWRARRHILVSLT